MAGTLLFHVVAFGLLVVAISVEEGCRLFRALGPVEWTLDIARCSRDIVDEDRWSRMVRQCLYQRSGRDGFGLI